MRKKAKAIRVGIAVLCITLLVGCSSSASSPVEQSADSTEPQSSIDTGSENGVEVDNQQDEFESLKKEAEELLQEGKYKEAVVSAAKAYNLVEDKDGEEDIPFKVAELLAEECGIENPKATLDTTVDSKYYRGIQIESDTLHQKSESELIKICEKLDEEGLDIIMEAGVEGGTEKPYLINDLVDGEKRYFANDGRLVVRTNEESTATTSYAPTESPKANQYASQEYQNALTKGLQYANQLHMSKKGIYKQLTSSYGEGFPADVAQYAVDNMTGVDWNANALAKAQEYYTMMSMSKSAVYNQLTSEAEGFTVSEAQYAIDHLS